jgi:hypothetical protein
MSRHNRNRNDNPQQPQQTQTPNFDLNALNSMDLGTLFRLLNNVDPNQIAQMLSQVKVDPNDERNILREGDPRIGVLNSLKPFLPKEQQFIIDEVIRVFSPKQQK